MLFTRTAFDSYSQFLGIVATAATASAAIFGYRVYEKLRGPKKETSISVYSRDESRLTEFLKRAKKEIHIVAITLEETTRASITIEQMLQKSEITKIRVLICNPTTPIKKEIERMVDADIDTIQSSLRALKRLKEKYSKLDVRVYDEIPVQSMFFLDPILKSGIMTFETYIFGIPKGKRKIHELKRKRKQKALFDIYYESYENLWNAGKSPEWNE